MQGRGSKTSLLEFTSQLELCGALFQALSSDGEKHFQGFPTPTHFTVCFSLYVVLHVGGWLKTMLHLQYSSDQWIRQHLSGSWTPATPYPSASRTSAVRGERKTSCLLSTSSSLLPPISPFPELPSVSVTYRQPPCPSPSPVSSSSPPHPTIGSKEKEKLLGSFTILRNKFRNISQKTRARVESPRSGPSLRTYIEPDVGRGEGKEEEREQKMATNTEGHAEAPPVPSFGRYSSSGRSDSFGRGVRPGYRGMRRSGSDDTMSSQSTLVPHSSLLHSEDPPLGIADLIHTSRPTLTQSRVRAHERSRQHSYQAFRTEVGKRGRGREEEKEEDQRTIEGLFLFIGDVFCKILLWKCWRVLIIMLAHQNGKYLSKVFKYLALKGRPLINASQSSYLKL